MNNYLAQANASSAVDARSVALAATQETVIALLGAPRATTELNGYLILRYHSNTPTYAHYLFFQNNELVFKQIGRERYELPIQDSLQLVVHVWPQKGIAIITEGIDPNSPIYQLQQFQPTTLQDYLQSWGKDFAAHERLTIQTPKILQQAEANVPTTTVSEHVAPDYVVILIVVALGAIVLVVALKIVFMIIRKFKKPNTTI
ncbi:MAG: hypothetical protein UV59_C0026G0006 [Candidatus Gottesmanbacteria bacterium GW2011_GWA1_43_11]|uniref:Uncharacterized protein n=1 Tax=Candidatus Gottesmanbacteria bacterium GW2011_GWA1_43_11 TaxID=1618436 RepID=A0A0G1EM99_9BACT|nr:MAG: hypothetical protein UV59_C0026G0006 [Candidatus Gottesmanbacteria bacterium GW2011_GWA1_43_11]